MRPNFVVIYNAAILWPVKRTRLADNTTDAESIMKTILDGGMTFQLKHIYLYQDNDWAFYAKNKDISIDKRKRLLSIFISYVTWGGAVLQPRINYSAV
jgi:hypothetical protein